MGLRRRDVDPLHGTLSVVETRTRMMSGKTITKGPKSDSGRRTVAVPSHLLAELKSHLERHVEPEPTARLVTVSTAELDDAWRTARASFGRPTLRIHDLRHTGLTLAAATGATIAELMHRAGHSSPAAAIRYQHATRDRDKILADALAALAQAAPVVPMPKAPDEVRTMANGPAGAR